MRRWVGRIAGAIVLAPFVAVAATGLVVGLKAEPALTIGVVVWFAALLIVLNE